MTDSIIRMKNGDAVSPESLYEYAMDHCKLYVPDFISAHKEEFLLAWFASQPKEDRLGAIECWYHNVAEYQHSRSGGGTDAQEAFCRDHGEFFGYICERMIQSGYYE